MALRNSNGKIHNKMEIRYCNNTKNRVRISIMLKEMLNLEGLDISCFSESVSESG